MARDIAHGEIVIGVDLERVGAELKHAEAQFDRTMKNIDRMRGEAEVGVKMAGLERDIHEAKKRIKELDAMQADPSVELDEAQFNKDYADTLAKLKALDEQRTELKIETKELKAANRELKVSEQRQAQMAKRWLEARRNEERFQSERRRGLATQQQALELERRRAVELEKLRLQYIKLHDEIEKGSRQKLFDFFGDENARLRFAQTEAELRRVKERIIDIGGRDTDFRKLERASDSANSRLRNMVSSLGAVRLHLGFFSASLKQAAIGFTALGPVIFGLAGQLAALVGVLGTGLTGALAVAGAGAAGFGLSALGIGLIMKPLIGDLQDAMKASKAYGDAVRKYGKDATQAQTAQEKLNQTLGDVGPETRKAFQALSGMSDRWGELTSSARPMFFETMAKGIQAANRLMPMFAQQSVAAFNTAGRETQKWLALISGPEAAAGIKSLMSNFTASFPALNDGFRAIFSGLSRAAVSASKLLPSLTSGFRDWGRNIESAIGTGGGLDAKIRRLVDHMREVGHFAQSAGRMLAAFFNAGANEGAGLLSTLTSIFNRWTAWMHTAGGQQSLANFFAQANSIGKQFIGTLAQIGVAVFEFSQAFAPLSQGFMLALNTASQFVAAVMRLEAARAVITGVGAALGTAFAVGKVMAFGRVLMGIPAAISAIGAAMSGGGLAALFATPAGPWIALAAGIVGVGVALSQLSGGAASAAQSIAAAESAARTMQQTFSDLARIDLDMLGRSLDVAMARTQVAAAQKNLNQAVNQYGKNSDQARSASINLKTAQQGLAQAQHGYNTALNEQGARAKKTFAEHNGAVQKAHDNVVRLRQEVERADKQRNGATAGSTYERWKEATEELATAQAKLTEVQAKADRANQRIMQSDLQRLRSQHQAVGVVNGLGRAWANVKDVLSGITPDAIDRIGSVFETAPKKASEVVRQTSRAINQGFGKQANRILINPKLNDREVLAQLRQLTQKAQKPARTKLEVDTAGAERKVAKTRGDFGRGKTSVKVDADTKNAEKNINKVTGKKGKQTTVQVRAEGVAQVTAQINRVANRKIPAKKVQITANPGPATSAINRVQGAKIPVKKLTFEADTSRADAANRKVQGFRDKTVRVNTQGDTSGAAAAQAAINAIPSNTNKYVTTVHRSRTESAQGSMPGPTQTAGPRVSAADKRNSRTSAQANVQRNRPGIYRRPTLLVGEEREDEWVIASNPSYRAANERYLADAANRFGYQLAPIEGAATGKGRSGKKAAQSYARNRTGYVKKNKKKGLGGYSYDFITDQISKLEALSSARESDRDARAARYPNRPLDKIKPSVASIIEPLNKIKNKWYNELAYNLNARAQASAKAADRARKKMGGGKAGVSDDIKRAEADVKRIRKQRPKSDKGKRKRDRNLRIAERKLENLREQKQNARRAYDERGNAAGQMWRELQGLKNDRYALNNRIAAIRDGEKQRRETRAESGGPGGSDSTPMGIQLGQLDTARYDTWQSFAGNLLGAGVQGGLPGGPLGPAGGAGGGGFPGGAPGGGFTASGPSFYSAAGGGANVLVGGGASPAGSGPATQSAGGGGTVVNQNIKIEKPPPDPHSFSKQLGWEAAAMLG